MQHEENHLNLFTCDVCGKKCTSKSFLTNHKSKNKTCRRKRSNSSSSTPSLTGSLQCSDCSYTTNIKQNLTRHKHFGCKGKGKFSFSKQFIS